MEVVPLRRRAEDGGLVPPRNDFRRGPLRVAAVLPWVFACSSPHAVSGAGGTDTRNRTDAAPGTGAPAAVPGPLRYGPTVAGWAEAPTLPLLEVDEPQRRRAHVLALVHDDATYLVHLALAPDEDGNVHVVGQTPVARLAPSPALLDGAPLSRLSRAAAAPHNALRRNRPPPTAPARLLSAVAGGRPSPEAWDAVLRAFDRDVLFSPKRLSACLSVLAHPGSFREERTSPRRLAVTGPGGTAHVLVSQGRPRVVGCIPSPPGNTHRPAGGSPKPDPSPPTSP